MLLALFTLQALILDTESGFLKVIFQRWKRPVDEGAVSQNRRQAQVSACLNASLLSLYVCFDLLPLCDRELDKNDRDSVRPGDKKNISSHQTRKVLEHCWSNRASEPTVSWR